MAENYIDFQQVFISNNWDPFKIIRSWIIPIVEQNNQKVEHISFFPHLEYLFRMNKNSKTYKMNKKTKKSQKSKQKNQGIGRKRNFETFWNSSNNIANKFSNVMIKKKKLFVFYQKKVQIFIYAQQNMGITIVQFPQLILDSNLRPMKNKSNFKVF
ncbi:hypothetical protein ABPG72_007099 [Tetrahymena utriculariae]